MSTAGYRSSSIDSRYGNASDKPQPCPLCAVRPDVASPQDGLEDVRGGRILGDEPTPDLAWHDEGVVVARLYPPSLWSYRDRVLDALDG